MKKMTRGLSVLLILVLFFNISNLCFAESPDSMAFDFQRVFGGKETFTYDKFEKKWAYYEAYIQKVDGAEFGIGLKIIGNGEDGRISETDLYIICKDSKGNSQLVQSVDFLIDDDLYSFSKLYVNSSSTSLVCLGRKGNLLIEALGFSDPNNVSVRIKTDSDTYIADLDPEQFSYTLKDFCKTYLIEQIWEYYSEYDTIEKIEALYPLYVNNEPADYDTMRKDRDISKIDETFTVSAPSSTPGSTKSTVAGKVGDYYVELKDWSIKKDYEGKPVLVLTYTWTNNSDDTTMASLSVSIEAYQNGVSLDSAYFIDGVDTSSGIKNVQPGYSLDVQTAFNLSDTKSDVSIVVSDLWDFFGSSTPLRATIHLS